jgi:hypothetical protein
MLAPWLPLANPQSIITKKLLVAGVSKALKLDDGHFSKLQQKELADIATEILVRQRFRRRGRAKGSK